jgi:phosphate:Na+ symporter
LAGVLQSGTIVSTMVIAFAGAGLLSLGAGIGVIVGANVGGTFLSVIIAKLWFGFSVSTWALPLLAVWGIMQFPQNKRIKLIGQLILSFGLLLFGIGYLKDSVEVLAAGLDVAQYANMGRYVFFGGWALLALLLHSSGTTTIIAMTAMFSGLISFEQTIITMLGASIGSALVSLYVSRGWSAIKRQIAYAHVWFNVIGSLLFLPLVWYVSDIMSLFLGEANSTGPDAVAWFQVLYNVVAAIVVYPFISPIARLMERFVHTDDHQDYQLASIGQSSHKKYYEMLRQDVLMFLKKVFKFNVQNLSINQKILLNHEYTMSEKYYAVHVIKNEKLAEDYDIISTIEESLLHELLKRLHTGNEKDDKALYPFYEAIQHIAYSAKAMEDSREYVSLLAGSENLMIRERMQTLREGMVDLYVIISHVIDNKSLKGNNAGIKKALNEVTHSSEALLDLLGKHLHRETMPKGELSSLLHLTSATQRSHRSMVKGVESLWD